MLRSINENTSKDRIWDEEICLKIKVGSYWWKIS